MESIDHYFSLLTDIFETQVLMRNIIFRIYPSVSCHYAFVGQLLTLQLKVKITLKIHLGSSTRLWPFQDMSQETWGCFEHAVNVQLPMLSAFWGDAVNLALPVGQERNRNIFVYIQPMESILKGQMSPRLRDRKNTEGYKSRVYSLSPSLSPSFSIKLLQC